jgi:hypothetical protein
VAALPYSLRTYLSKLEKGASYAGLEIIWKLASVLEVEPRRGTETANSENQARQVSCY